MKKAELERMRRDRAALVQELEDAGGVFESGNSLRCPFHEDENPSGSVFQGDDGAWRFRCHGCDVAGDVFDLRARRLRLPLADVLKQACAAVPYTTTPLSDQKPKRPPMVFASIEAIKARTWPGKILETVYEYTHPETRRVEMVVVRYRENGGKSFFMFRRCTAGFEMLAPEKPWPIYNRGRVAASETVVVVEGEKCVHALQELGIVATTSPGGAKSAASADWSPLAGKDVRIWPDADVPGLQYGRDVTGILAKLDPAPRLFWVDPGEYELSDGADVVDVLQELQGDIAYKRGMIETLLQQAKPYVSEPAAQSERKRPILRSAREICALQIPPVAWAVTGLLPTGLSLLAGKPKAGKSFLALHLGLAVSQGGCALGSREYAATQGNVIALLLEDTDRRLQNRLTKLQQGQPQPDGLHISIQWPRGEEGLAALRERCEELQPRLVIVDTLAQFRALSHGRNANAYESDYLAISGLKHIADDFDMALLVLHHQRKMSSDDIYDSVSGTLGLTGAADSTFILMRAKAGGSSILSGRGRDLDDFSLAVQFDKPTGLWRLLGEAHEVMLSTEKQDILKALREAGTPLGPSAIAKAIGKPANLVGVTLFRMVNAGDILRANRGCYTL